MASRIASLLPSATEIVCALGARGMLVGISHECDFPDGLSGLPVLTRARLGPVKTSLAIHDEVRGILENALAVYEIELERLEAARPDIIVTQDLCDVCAVSLADVRAAALTLSQSEVRIVSLRPSRLADIWADIVRVADALGRSEQGERVVADLEARVSAIAERARHLVGRPKVLTIEWIDPVMIGGMWMPELVRLAGGEPLVTNPGDHAPTLTRDALAELTPDVVLIKPCGFALSRTLAELAALERSLPWQEWRARGALSVYVADGNAYFNRPGPRIVESLEILAGTVHPGEFRDFRLSHRSSVVRLDETLRPGAFDAD